MTEAETVETKRKRQDSIKGSETTPVAAVDANEDLLISTPQEADEPSSAPPSPLPTASSPAKKPRVNLDDAEKGDDDQESSSGSEAAADAAHSVEAIELASEPQSVSVPAPAPTPAPTKVFGMGFGFASAAKKASPFAAYTSATSGFAKYAVKKDVEEESTEQSKAAAAVDDGEDGEKEKEDEQDEQTKVLSPKQSTKTFEDMLATQGAETLESTAAPSVAPAEPTSPTEPVRTFEEDETCRFTTKGKLFELASGNWKERGGGQFKINQHNDNKRRRMVMRTDLTFRLILNAPMFAGMKAVCERRFVRFACFDADSKTPTTFALRFPNEAAAKSAFAAIEQNIPGATDSAETVGDAAEQGADETSAASSRASSEEAASEHEADGSEAADEEAGEDEEEEEAVSDYGDESEEEHEGYEDPEDQDSENADDAN
ncbi:hypothetical protein LPJ73_001346 [Coemansia sp. RSA 2703]|nr:hypothetical protein LPJ73_001346 [Coemansia sp. RSA 2703]KAJ2377410.1 hypothetical protein IW150_001399 [Coemansia sp. RSA 2607]